MSAEGIGNQLESTTSIEIIRVYASYDNLNIYFISERTVASLMQMEIPVENLVLKIKWIQTGLPFICVNKILIIALLGIWQIFSVNK